MKHEQFLGLPADTKQKLDVALTQGKTTKACAEMLKADGLFTDTSVPTLARALREYRTDTITIPTEARRHAFEQHADPRTRARVREVVTALGVHAGWKKMIDAAEKTHWLLVEQMSKLGAASALSDRLRQSSLTLSKLYSDYSKFLLDSGLIPKPAAQLHITSANVVIQDYPDAVALMEALLDFYARKGGTPHHWLPGIQEMQAAAENPRLTAPKSLTTTMDRKREMQRSLEASMDRLAKDPALAETVGRMRAAVRGETLEEPEPEVVGVPIDDGLEIEVLAREPERRGVVIDAERDDGMPRRLEDVW